MALRHLLAGLRGERRVGTGAWGASAPGKGWVASTLHTSGPSETQCRPRNLEVLPSPGLPFRLRLSSGPPFSIPETSSRLRSRRLRRDSAPARRTSPDLAGASCFPRAPPSPAALAARPCRVPPSGCGSPRRGSRQRKFPGPGPAGSLAVAAPGKEPAARLPRGVLRHEWGHRMSRLRVLFSSPGAAEGALAASAAGGPPAGLRAPPGRGGVSGIGPERLCTPSASPEDAEPRLEHDVPGALARSGKKRAVFAFVNKRGRSSAPAQRPPSAPCLPARRRRAPRAPGRLPRAPGGSGDCWAPGAGLRRCRRSRRRARRPRSPSLPLRSCRTREQQVAEDTESSAHACGAQTAAGAALGPPCRPQALLGSGCAFCLHARGHTVT